MMIRVPFLGAGYFTTQFETQKGQKVPLGYQVLCKIREPTDDNSALSAAQPEVNPALIHFGRFPLIPKLNRDYSIPYDAP